MRGKIGLPKSPSENAMYTANGQGLRWRCWDGEFIVFNSMSADTHRLDVTTSRILACIQDRRMTLNEICAELAAFLNVSDEDGEIEQAALNILMSLQQADLIRAERC